MVFTSYGIHVYKKLSATKHILYFRGTFRRSKVWYSETTGSEEHDERPDCRIKRAVQIFQVSDNTAIFSAPFTAPRSCN